MSHSATPSDTSTVAPFFSSAPRIDLGFKSVTFISQLSLVGNENGGHFKSIERVLVTCDSNVLDDKRRSGAAAVVVVRECRALRWQDSGIGCALQCVADFDLIASGANHEISTVAICVSAADYAVFFRSARAGVNDVGNSIDSN
jgi:hypothetical protein